MPLTGPKAKAQLKKICKRIEDVGLYEFIESSLSESLKGAARVYDNDKFIKDAVNLARAFYDDDIEPLDMPGPDALVDPKARDGLSVLVENTIRRVLETSNESKPASDSTGSRCVTASDET